MDGPLPIVLPKIDYTFTSKRESEQERGAMLTVTFTAAFGLLFNPSATKS